MNNSIKLIWFSIFSVSFFSSFFSSSAQADSINVPLIYLISINSNKAGGQLYNSLVGPSKLSRNLDSFNWKQGKQPTNDYQINGAIYTNCPTDRCNGNNGILVEVSPNPLKLTNGYSEITMDLRGLIGTQVISENSGKSGVKLKKSPISINLGWQSDIEIIGDIDESSISFEDRPGDYTGTFTIQASKI